MTFPVIGLGRNDRSIVSRLQIKVGGQQHQPGGLIRTEVIRGPDRKRIAFEGH